MDRNQLRLQTNDRKTLGHLSIVVWGWVGLICFPVSQGLALQWTPGIAKSSRICPHCSQNSGKGGALDRQMPTAEQGWRPIGPLAPLLPQAPILRQAWPQLERPAGQSSNSISSNPISSNPISSNPISSNPISSNPISTNPISSNPISQPLATPRSNPLRQLSSRMLQPLETGLPQREILAVGGLAWESLAEKVDSPLARQEPGIPLDQENEELLADILEIRASFGGSVARILSNDPEHSAAGERLFAEQLRELFEQESGPAHPPVPLESGETLASQAMRLVPLPSPDLRPVESSMPGARKAGGSQVQALRRAAQQLEQVAADLEEAGLYDQADSVREKGVELWKSARAIEALPQAD